MVNQMKKKINLIIIAMEEELNEVLPLLNDYQVNHDDLGTYYTFSKNEEDYLLILGKVGKVATGLTLGKICERYEVKKIFNMGTAGTFKDDIDVGDVIIASVVQYHDVDVTGFNYALGQIPSNPPYYTFNHPSINVEELNKESNFKVYLGKVISGDTFITLNNVNKIDKEILQDALCGEMESGAVAQVSYILNIPCVIIRTHVYKKDNALDMDQNIKLASHNGAMVLLRLL